MSTHQTLAGNDDYRQLIMQEIWTITHPTGHQLITLGSAEPM